MNKFKITPQLVDVLSEGRFFSKPLGVKQFSTSEVLEKRLGKKYIYTPRNEDFSLIKKISDILKHNYFDKIPLNQAATAYVAEKSYLNFIEPHRGNFFFVRLDIKNFFHSIKKSVLTKMVDDYFLNEPIGNGVEQTHTQAIYNLLTIKVMPGSKNIKFHDKEILPVGYFLSPIISNIIFRKIDILIEDFCAKNNIKYTRYADDMLFSCRAETGTTFEFTERFGMYFKFKTPFLHTDKFFSNIAEILRIDGYKINLQKLTKATHTLSLNGYVISGSNSSDISGVIRVSNKKTKIIDKLLFELNANKDDVSVFYKCFKDDIPQPKFQRKSREFIIKYCESQLNNKLSGYFSYLYSIVKFNDLYDCVDKKSIEKYNDILQRIKMIMSKRNF